MIFIGDMVLFFLAGLAHWWWTANLSVYGVSPNLIFIAALTAAVMARPAKALAYGFFLGIYLDLLGTSVFGINALSYTLMAYGVYVLKKHFNLLSSFFQMIAALVFSVLTMLLYQGLSLVLAKIGPLELKAFLVEPFLNAALAPFAGYFFANLKKKFDIL